MWPVLLNMTRDECRRTLRRLELEAYSNMINVFRAQGALEENRSKLLQELRAVLHISHERHSAEARRVSNDELLATIAEHLAGPNTGLRWISEGRRKIPLLPRGIPQTMYTEIADKVSEASAAENKEIQKNKEAEKLVAPRIDEEDVQDAEGQTAECPMDIESMEEAYSPIAMEDHTAKIWETEIICRKRKPEPLSDDNITAVKNKRNVPINANQRHLNLSQVYSKFSQPAVSKSSSQSKHSYNQVSKVSTSKSSQTRVPRTRKPRQNKQKQDHTKTKAIKKSKDVPISPSNQYNPVPMHLDYSGPPNTFQASYAQSILSSKNRTDFPDGDHTKATQGIINDSQTMRLLSQPTNPHELGDSENAHPNNPITLEPKTIPVSKPNLSKPCQLVLKKRDADKRIQVSDFKIVQKTNDNLKLQLTNRPVIVAPNSAQRPLNSQGKLVTTKVIGSIPKARPTTTPVLSEKMVVVSKPLVDHRITHPKIIITSSSTSTPIKTSLSASIPSKTIESLTPKGIPATDLKVSAKAFVLNPKSGQKMVVLPAKTSKEGQVPMFHFKGIPTPMKLVSVSSQPNTQTIKTNPVNPKPAVVNTFPTNAKILGVETIKTANLADIVPVKGLTPVTQKITNPMIRPVNPKGNVIVVQKSATIGKAVTFTKNGNDMSKIIMGKNVNKLLQAKKSEPGESSKSSNVIVLELNNEQSGRTTTLSEILDSRGTNIPRDNEQASRVITEDTPVLFDTQIAEENCNPNSLDSSTSINDIVPIEETTINALEKTEGKSNYSHTEVVKDSSSVTDWEMELETVSRKDKDEDDKLNSLHLDLGMSSESDSEYIVGSRKAKSENSSQDSIQQDTQSGMSSEMYSGSSGLSLATRTLLSQLHDEESSNDSSFTLKAKKSDVKDIKIDKSESEALSKAKAKLVQKVAEATSRQKRIDVYSTAITTSDINLDSFSYLDEGMMTGDDVFAQESKRDNRRNILDEHLSGYLGEDSANSTDSQTVSESITSNEQ